MEIPDKILTALRLQIRKSGVKIPKISDKCPTIDDMNQAIHNGAINESKSESDLRSQVKAQ